MFLDPKANRPRVIAHRGARYTLQNTPVDENSLESFAAALAAGAEIIETDIQCTKDGVPVVFHDADLERLTGLPKKLSQVSFAELQQLRLPHGAAIPSLQATLDAFKSTKFNIDFKSHSVIDPACKVIRQLDAEDRVLVASFSWLRICRAHRRLQSSVKSLSAVQVQFFYWATKLNWIWLGRFITSSVVALQIPVSFNSIQLDTERFIQFAHRCNVEVHYWVINEPGEMLRLKDLGADGLITDHPAIATTSLPRTSRQP